ncbi:MAG: biopolymer transporter ExbD [Pseudomonadota bacterium]
MRRKYGNQEDDTAIDLTPMLDVVFIMLIFFIVTASFVKEDGLSVIRPQNNQDQPPPEEENKNILVTIDQTNTISINRLRVDQGSVLPRLKQLLADRPEAAVVISSKEGATVETYSAVHEAAKLAGVANVVMATEQ